MLEYLTPLSSFSEKKRISQHHSRSSIARIALIIEPWLECGLANRPHRNNGLIVSIAIVHHQMVRNSVLDIPTYYG